MNARALLAALALLASSLGAPRVAARAGSFIIFFGSGEARLDEVDRAILDNLAAALQQEPRFNLLITGYADRAGSLAHNRALACRRARAARAYLRTLGIAATRMAVRSAGEERPMVDTDNGVAEVQNRYVQFQTIETPLPAAARRDGRCLPPDF